jgi:hypothetical protein
LLPPLLLLLQVFMEQRVAAVAEDASKQIKQWKSDVNRVQRKLNQRGFDNLVQQHEIERLQQQLNVQQQKADMTGAAAVRSVVLRLHSGEGGRGGCQHMMGAGFKIVVEGGGMKMVSAKSR